jgi:matrixin
VTVRFWWLLAAAALMRAESFTYWIQPCSAEIAHETTCTAGDPELAEWALNAWQRAARPDLTFAPGAEDQARIRVYWASGRMRLYGEARPIKVDGKRGSAIYVNPDVTQLGEEIHLAAERDPLLREAIVYLTCLHESGHAIGLSHTGKFEDIMYSFGFGGDIVEYFERYRRKIGVRQDIRGASAISAYDRQRLLALLKKHP